MYIPDLDTYANYSSPKAERPVKVLAVGWLDSEHSYATGDVSSDFKERLELFCSMPLLQIFGMEMCPICKKLEVVRIKLNSGKEISLHGFDEIRIPSKDGKKVYAASDFIIHYVIVHQYLPPQEFIDAVLAAPLPDTPAYEVFAAEWENDY